MRLFRKVKLEGRDQEVEVRELRVKDIRRLLDIAGRMDAEKKPTGKKKSRGGYAKDLSLAEQLAGMNEALALCCDLKPEEIDDLAPSEIKVLWEAFRETNAVFFNALEASGVLEAFKQGARKILTDLSPV